MRPEVARREAPEVPEGVPAPFKLSTAARVLNLSERTVRHWADTGALEVVQLEELRWRYVRAAEVARLAGWLGIEPDWEKAI